MPETTEELSCLSEVSKVDLHNVINTWLYKKVGELEKHKNDPTTDKEWLEAFEKRLEEVSQFKNKILDFKTCKSGKL